MLSSSNELLMDEDGSVKRFEYYYNNYKNIHIISSFFILIKLIKRSEILFLLNQIDKYSGLAVLVPRWKGNY